MSATSSVSRYFFRTFGHLIGDLPPRTLASWCVRGHELDDAAAAALTPPRQQRRVLGSPHSPATPFGFFRPDRFRRSIYIFLVDFFFLFLFEEDGLSFF